MIISRVKVRKSQFTEMNGKNNPAFLPSSDEAIQATNNSEPDNETNNPIGDEELVGTRDEWGKSIEFLFSCIALSVGLGNIWRFPYVALENGGKKLLKK